MELRRGEHWFGAGRVNERWRYSIHVDVMRTPLYRQALGKVGNPGLRHAIDRLCGKCYEASLRTHIDDASAALLLHYLARGLAREKSAFEIDGECAIKVLLAHVESEIGRRDARIVD
jgi:hypothetical protein